jgi:DNA-binding NarL/FixJ family response regulator
LEPPDFSGIFKIMKQKEPKSFLIIDDHALMASAIIQLLKCDFQHAVYYTAGNGKEALEILKVTPVDMIFLDVSMPEMNGYETFPILKRDYPDIRVILLTMLYDESVVHHFIQLGITAIMLKSCEEGVGHCGAHSVGIGWLFFR